MICIRENQTAAKWNHTLMKRQIRIAVGTALLLLATLVQSHAQNLVQTLGVSLVAYDAERNRTISIGTPQLIQYLWGTNVPNGRLYLVTPMGNPPGMTGPLNAFLRLTRGTNILYEFSSVTEFNLYQDVAVLRTNGLTISTHALNRFSFDTGGVRAELQGISTWNISRRLVNGVDLSGTGSFLSSVNGWIGIYSVTQSVMPIKGSIIASSPKLGP